MSGDRHFVVVGDRVGDLAPLGRVPTLGARRHLGVDADERERRQALEAHRRDDLALRVAEHEELVGERAEEPARVLLVGRRRRG